MSPADFCRPNLKGNTLKNSPVLTSLIIGVALVASSALIGNAIVQHGKSLEKAGEAQRPAPIPASSHTSIPSRLTLDLRLTTPNGEPLRIESTSK
jgi:hypothetical protein